MNLNYDEICKKVINHAKTYDINLDFSKKSIIDVDIILDDFYTNSDEYMETYSEKGIWNIAVNYGIYVGETLLRTGLTKMGFEWVIKNNMPALKKNNNEIFPINKVHKAMINGSGDNVKSFFNIAFMIAEDKLTLNKNKESNEI